MMLRVKGGETMGGNNRKMMGKLRGKGRKAIKQVMGYVGDGMKGVKAE